MFFVHLTESASPGRCLSGVEGSARNPAGHTDLVEVGQALKHPL